MEVNEQAMDRILAYLEGGMHAAERSRLEADLQEDPALREAFETARVTYSLLKADRHMQLQKEWTSVSQEEASTRFSRLTPFPLWIGYAVAAAMLLLLLFFWQADFSQSTSSQLAMAAFAPYPAPTTLRGETDFPSTDLDMGYQKYQIGDYTGALELLDTTGLASYKQIEVLLYRGISFMETADYGSAHYALEAALQLDPKVNREVLQWYQALNYLLMEQEANARPILQQLADQSMDIYGEKAKNLLLDLPSTRK
ncbi:MAG: hypothetical protein AAFW00_23415 [Bacteroidota bacterium]